MTLAATEQIGLSTKALRPTGFVPATTATMAPPLRLRAGTHIALLSNGKANGTELLEAVAQQLQQYVDHEIVFTHYRKPSVSVPPKDEDFAKIRDTADAVICAIGDCGSCSSRTMRDAIDFELAGVPAVAIIADALVVPVDYMRRLSGMPDYPFCITQFPVGNLTPDETMERAKVIAPEALTLLTTGRPEAAETADHEVRRPNRAAVLGFDSDEAALEAFHEQKWTDGLPVVIPTPERVAAMLERCNRAPDEDVFRVPTRHNLTVTVELVAVNAVMAGCLPEHFPAVLAAATALGDPRYNLHAHTATLAGAQQVFIINGPIRQRLGINSGEGALGPGTRANASIGRALRLLVRNGCHSVHGEFDRATFGHPGRFSWCFGEAEEESPWEPLSVEMGLPSGTDAVSLYASVWQASTICHSRDPEELLDEICLGARTQCHVNWLHADVAAENSFHERRPFLFVVGYQHAEVLRSGGYAGNKERLKEAIYRRLIDPASPLRPVAISSPENVRVVYVHGTGIQQTWFFGPFQSHEMVTAPIESA